MADAKREKLEHIEEHNFPWISYTSPAPAAPYTHVREEEKNFKSPFYLLLFPPPMQC